MIPLRLPITARVPLIVTLFMMAVSAFASERVPEPARSDPDAPDPGPCRRLSGRPLTGPRRCHDPRGRLAGVRRARQVTSPSGGNRPAETIVASQTASSSPRRTRSRPLADRGCPRTIELAIRQDPSSRCEPARPSHSPRDVLYESRSIGSIYAALDIAPQLAERNEVLWTLILTNALLTLCLRLWPRSLSAA